jgi:S-(hydroxymethyl)glutathione dehydrogenase / alcohol dehydrogenase
VKIRAAVLEELGSALEIQELELAEPKAGEVLVGLVACGVCRFGADYAFVATGSAQVMRQAMESARMDWGLATVCGVAGKGETLDIVPRFLITGRRVAGSSFGGVKGRDQVPRFVDQYLAGEIDVDPFVSHKLTLDDVNGGFELMEAGTGSAA